MTMRMEMNKPPGDQTTGKRLATAARLEANARGTGAEQYQQYLQILWARFGDDPSTRDVGRVRIISHLSIKPNYYKLHDRNGNQMATMAYFRQGQVGHATLVEWTNQTEEHAAKTSLLFQRFSLDLTLLPSSLGVANIPPSSRHGRRIGILLALPRSSGTFHQFPQPSGTVSQSLRPRTLEDLIGGRPIDLSARFQSPESWPPPFTPCTSFNICTS